jgi:hypothetical protein
MTNQKWRPFMEVDSNKKVPQGVDLREWEEAEKELGG